MQIPGLLLRALGEGTGVSAVNGCPSPSQFTCGTRSDQKPVDEQPWSVIGFLYKMRRWGQRTGRGVRKSKTGRILKERRVKDPSQQLKLEGTFTIMNYTQMWPCDPSTWELNWESCDFPSKQTPCPSGLHPSPKKVWGMPVLGVCFVSGPARCLAD